MRRGNRPEQAAAATLPTATRTRGCNRGVLPRPRKSSLRRPAARDGGVLHEPRARRRWRSPPHPETDADTTFDEGTHTGSPVVAGTVAALGIVPTQRKESLAHAPKPGAKLASFQCPGPSIRHREGTPDKAQAWAGRLRAGAGTARKEVPADPAQGAAALPFGRRRPTQVRNTAAASHLDSNLSW